MQLVGVMSRFQNSKTAARVFRYATASLVAISLFSVVVAADTWRGLKVEPEERCSSYSSRDYPYPQSVEPQIIRSIGKIYSPYTGRCFASRYETDIEHIVARSEAHDSGLCSASQEIRRQFSSDLLNLTLSSPQVNRHQKAAHDAADWLPVLNQCWFAGTVVAVKQKYGLSVDRREAEVLERILSACHSTEMMVVTCVNETPTVSSSPTGQGASDPLSVWDDNNDGRITCREARRHGIAPVPRNHPAYPYMRDGDGDGMVCE